MLLRRRVLPGRRSSSLGSTATLASIFPDAALVLDPGSGHHMFDDYDPIGDVNRITGPDTSPVQIMASPTGEAHGLLGTSVNLTKYKGVPAFRFTNGGGTFRVFNSAGAFRFIRSTGVFTILFAWEASQGGLNQTLVDNTQGQGANRGWELLELNDGNIRFRIVLAGVELVRVQGVPPAAVAGKIRRGTIIGDGVNCTMWLGGTQFDQKPLGALDTSQDATYSLAIGTRASVPGNPAVGYLGGLVILPYALDPLDTSYNAPLKQWCRWKPSYRTSIGRVAPATITSPHDVRGLSRWYSLRHQYMYQDTAATTPVNGAAQPVARVNPRTNHPYDIALGRQMTQATASLQAQSRADGDGVDVAFDNLSHVGNDYWGGDGSGFLSAETILLVARYASANESTVAQRMLSVTNSAEIAILGVDAVANPFGPSQRAVYAQSEFNNTSHYVPAPGDGSLMVVAFRRNGRRWGLKVNHNPLEERDVIAQLGFGTLKARFVDLFGDGNSELVFYDALHYAGALPEPVIDQLVDYFQAQYPEPSWYLPDTDPESVTVRGAWQAIGSTSYRNSLVNLITGVRATEMSGAVTWDRAIGWTFTGANNNCLLTDVAPQDENWTYIVRFANAAGGSVFGLDGGPNGPRTIQISPGTVRYANGGLRDVAPAHPNGTLAIAGLQPYRDGVAESILPGGWTNNINKPEISIGGRNLDNGFADSEFTGDVLAFAIYEGVLTDTQVAEVSAKMAAL